MYRYFPDTGISWVAWLREQAANAYVWDEASQYWHVRRELPHKVYPGLKTAWRELSDLRDKFPHMDGNLFVRSLSAMDGNTKARIEDFFMAQGYTDFQFLDLGGRALAFRTRHIPSGQIHVARMEAPHAERCVRPVHPVVLQALSSNEGEMHIYDDIKLEVLPEIVPLTKLKSPMAHTDNELLRDIFYSALCGLGHGTNLMYPQGMFDRDCEPQNVGVRPDGRIVTFDPAFLFGRKAENRQRRSQTPELLQDASSQQLRLLYPTILEKKNAGPSGPAL